MNYAVKPSFLLALLESSLEVAAKLKEPNTRDRMFEDVETPFTDPGGATLH